jgi:hypothetical protein
MSDLYEDDDNDSTLVKQLRKALRDANKKVDDLTTENTTLAKQVRSKSVEEILASKGADKRLAKYIPADVNDEAGVTAWLESDGDLFGYQKGTDDSAGDSPAGLSPEDAEAAQRVQQASGGSAITDRQKQQLEAIRNAKSKEELDALVFGQTTGN